MASGPGTIPAAASMKEMTIVLVMATLRLGMAAKQGWRRSCETSGVEENEERREQMNSVRQALDLVQFVVG